MLISFIWFNIALILRIFYLVSWLATIQSNWKIPTQCLFGFFIYIDNLFFNWGVLLSIFNWLHLIMKLNQYLSYMKNPINVKSLVVLLIMITVLLTLFFISSFAVTWYISEDSFNQTDAIIRIIRIIIFSLEAVIFSLVGLKLSSQLSRIITIKYK